MSEFNLVRKGVDFIIADDEIPIDKSNNNPMASPEECDPDFTDFALAPKGKPRAAPLIHERIRPEASEMICNLEGCDPVPLKKSKSSSHELKLMDPQSTKGSKNQASTGSQSARSTKSKDSSQSSKTTYTSSKSVERVRISKGIEMKRVVQDASGLKPKSHQSLGSTAVNQRSVSKTGHPSTSPRSKKMTKTSAACPEVKVKRYLEERTSGTGSSTSIRSKPSNSDFNSKGNVTKREEKVNNAVSNTCSATAVASLEEFLQLPETNIPEMQSRSKKLYKSKFWDYINPSSKSSGSDSKKNQKKPYNPDEVKSFMQKQKEARKMQQLTESKKKKEQQEKRQRMLKELENHYSRQRSGIGKGKQCLSETDAHASYQAAADKQNEEGPCTAKKTKTEDEPPPQSPSLKYLKPLLERKHGTSFLRRPDGKSEAAKQAQYLLSEFEHIVKRECISFLNQIPKPLEAALHSNVEKEDKAVGTSSTPELESEPSIDAMLKFNVHRPEEHLQGQQKKYVVSPTIEKAVIKIQAAYRGYKVRDALRRAHVNLIKRPRLSEQPQIQSQSHRRWSFAGLPEKPYPSTSLSRVVPMSPIPLSGFNPSCVPCYIPPPPPASQTPRSPAKPRVLPSIALTPVRLRIYDEPYPKQTSTSTPLAARSSSSMTGNPASASSDRNLNQAHHRQSLPASNNFSLTRAIENLPLPQSSVRPLEISDIDFTIPSALPSVLDAFREKLSLFKLNMKTHSSKSPSGESSDEKENKPEVSKSSSKTYTTDFESISSQTKITAKSGISTSEDITETPKMKGRKRRSRSRSESLSGTLKNLSSKSSTSATSIEHGEEYDSNESSHRASVPSKSQLHSTDTNDKTNSEGPIGSQSYTIQTTSNSVGGLLAPALRLRYEAERERLKVIDKALHVSLLNKANTTMSIAPPGDQGMISSNHHHHVSSSSPSSTPQKENSSSSTMDERPQKLKSSESIQYAIAKVQKESMRAAAEMAKWMAEFQKSSKEHEQVQTQKSSVDLAAMVYAAVEEARHLGEEKRREKLGKAKKEEHNKHPRGRDYQSSPSGSFMTEVEPSRPEKRKVVEKVDKSVETSLIVPENRLEEVWRRGDKQPVKEAMLRDYQQQFPSDSERSTTPMPHPQQISVPPLQAVNFSVGAVSAGTGKINQQSKNTQVDDRECVESSNYSVRDDASLEYPSIIPSGNSVEITSLDPKVSSLQDGTFSTSSAKTEIEESQEDHQVPESVKAIALEDEQSDNINEEYGTSESHQEDETFEKADEVEDHAETETGTGIHDDDEASEVEEVEDLVETEKNEGVSEIEIVDEVEDLVEIKKHKEISEIEIIDDVEDVEEFEQFEEASEAEVVDEVSKSVSRESLEEKELVQSKEEEEEEKDVEQSKTPSKTYTTDFESASSEARISEKSVDSTPEQVTETPKLKLRDISELIPGSLKHTSSKSSPPFTSVEQVEDNASINELSGVELSRVSAKKQSTDSDSKTHADSTEASPRSQSCSVPSTTSESRQDESSKVVDEVEDQEETKQDEGASEVAEELRYQEPERPASEEIVDEADDLEESKDHNEASVVIVEVEYQEKSEKHDEASEVVEEVEDQEEPDKHAEASEIVEGEKVQEEFDKLAEASETVEEVKDQEEEPDNHAAVSEIVEAVKVQEEFDKHTEASEMVEEVEDQEESKQYEDVFDEGESEKHEPSELLDRMEDQEEPKKHDEASVQQPHEVEERDSKKYDATFEEGDEVDVQEEELEIPEEISEVVDEVEDNQEPEKFDETLEKAEEFEEQEEAKKLDKVSKLVEEEEEFQEDQKICNETFDLGSKVENLDEQKINDETFDVEEEVEDLAEPEGHEAIAEVDELGVIEEPKKDLEVESSEELDLKSGIENKTENNEKEGVREVPVYTSKPQNMVQIHEMYGDIEIPLKPPPPYSPSSSLDSTSISSRSLMICLAKEKLEKIVHEEADIMWDAWASGDKCLPDIDTVLRKRQSSSEEYSAPVNDSNGNLESLNNAIDNFDSLLWHLVYESTKEALQGEMHSLSYIERVRPGPLAMRAQTFKVPRSKEELKKQVYSNVMKTIPSSFFRDLGMNEGAVNRKSKKWCSRPRELVDEILLEELEKENYQWTEWWPEEKIIIHNAANNIIRSLIRNALEKRTYVYEQGWPKCLQFKYDVLKNSQIHYSRNVTLSGEE